MIVLSLFDGMSCGRLALERAGIEVTEYYASEINPCASLVAMENYPDTIHLGDAKHWKNWEIPWEKIDLIIGGSPCQGFSFQGKHINFQNPKSILFFIYHNILEHTKKLNPNVKFLLENVKMKQENLDLISEYLGVQPTLINSILVTCQIRERYYWTNFDITLPQPRNLTANDMFDYPGWRMATTKKGDPRMTVFTEDIAGCLTATYYKGIRGDGRPYWAQMEGPFDMLRSRRKIRPLSPEDCEVLQTVPVGYTKAVSPMHRYEMLGNGWTIDIISHIFTHLRNGSLRHVC